MMKDKRNAYKKRLGDYGEKLALQAYLSAGYTFLDKQYRCPLGEIDLIFKKDDLLIFVEVRTKTSAAYGTAEESITLVKIRRIRRVSEFYMHHHQLQSLQPQYDLITIYIDKRQKKAWLTRFPAAF